MTQYLLDRKRKQLKGRKTRTSDQIVDEKIHAADPISVVFGVYGHQRGDYELRKLLFATGILIILIGAVLASMYTISVTVKAQDIVAQEYNAWEVSWNFTVGDKIIAQPRYSTSWTNNPWDQDDLFPYNHRHIWFYMIDPTGNSTEWNTAWSGHNLNTGQLALIYINATILSDGLYVTSTAQNGSTYPTYLGGIALLNGTYTFKCEKEMEPTPANVTAPAWIGLTREYPKATSPYTSSLPIGISISGVGAVISIAAARRKKKTVRKRKTSLNQ